MTKKKQHPLTRADRLLLKQTLDEKKPKTKTSKVRVYREYLKAREASDELLEYQGYTSH